jgi:hypothetical protein
MDAIDIKNILMACVVSYDNKEIKDKSAFIESVISRHGFQQTSQLATLLVDYILLGEKKSSKIRYEERAKALTDNFINLKSTSLKKVLCLWVTTLTISTTFACMIIRFW